MVNGAEPKLTEFLGQAYNFIDWSRPPVSGNTTCGTK